MLRIAVDLDGTLADTMTPWCELCNKEYGTRLTVNDLTDWGAWRVAGISRDEFFQLLDKAWFEWERIPPVEEALGKKVSAVAKLGMVDVVTGRSIRTVPSAKNWLKRHSIPYRRFVRVGSMEDKIPLDYDVFVDDSPMIFEPVTIRPGRYVIAYSRPWNAGIPTLKRVLRVSSWTEIPSLLQSLPAE